MLFITRIHSLILTLLFVVSLFFSNKSPAQDYIHYAIRTGHTGGISDVAFSPDGLTLASGSWDKTIRLWDVSAGKHIRTLTGHTGQITSVVFSPDGTTLASGTSGIKGTTLRLWDVDTGRHIRTVIGHTDGISDVVFSPDGTTLASGSWDKTIRLWDVSAGKHIRTLTGHTGQITSVVFSPDGTTLASGSSDMTLRLWDAHTGRHLRTLTGHTDGISDVAFSPDGQTLASGSSDMTLRLWNVNIGRHLHTLTGHTDGISDVAFSPDGQTLASGSRYVRLWDADTGRHLRTLTEYTGWVTSIVFSPDGRTLANADANLRSVIHLWRISSPRPTPPKTTANQIYDNAIRSVMWIVNPNMREGSGVLIDKKFKLAITNAHVTDKQNTIDVFFPAPDENGELIKDRNFYLTNSCVLKRLGYYTKGHVVAKNEKTDIAIVKLDGLPETTREIDWSFTTPTTNAGELVYILGNPGGQDLWRWTLGEYLKDHGDFSHIQSDVFGGNSGGPVLNKQGILLGIVARSDRHMNALAIPVRDISRLLSKSQLKHSRSRR